MPAVNEQTLATTAYHSGNRNAFRDKSEVREFIDILFISISSSLPVGSLASVVVTSGSLAVVFSDEI